MSFMLFATPAAAESAFYKALENADLKAMMAVWELGEDSVCIHPLGPRLQGAEQIRDSWRRIFLAGIVMRFRISDIHGVESTDLAIRMVHENITVINEDQQAMQIVIATNIYRRGNRGGWNMIMHHASPGNKPGSTIGQNSGRRVH